MKGAYKVFGHFHPPDPLEMNFIDSGGSKIWTRMGAGNCEKSIKGEYYHQLVRSICDFFHDIRESWPYT